MKHTVKPGKTYSALMEAIINSKGDIEFDLVAELSERVAERKMDASSVIRISEIEENGLLVRTYAIRQLDGNVYVITLNWSFHNWGFQSGVVTISSRKKRWWS